MNDLVNKKQNSLFMRNLRKILNYHTMNNFMGGVGVVFKWFRGKSKINNSINQLTENVFTI